MPTKMTAANNASNNNHAMHILLTPSPRQQPIHRWWRALLGALALAILGGLSGCGSAKRVPAGASVQTSPDLHGGVEGSATGPVVMRTQSRWVPVAWSALPGWDTDAVGQAWPAWVRSCERPHADWLRLCPDVRRLAQAPEAAQRQWMQQHLQPHRVESHQAQTSGMLTAYYEPQLSASRQRTGRFVVPLYAPPAGLPARQPWFTRQQMDTHGPAQEALRGKALLYLSDPVDAMVLHIQGSGLVRVTEADGQVRTVRLAYAATNNQPYQSIGRWLLDQGLVRDASWPGIKAWIAQNPHRVQELLWQNPRVVFFKEEVMGAAPMGPKGAQGVPLTAGRSIAVDPGSVPYGAPVWLASEGQQVRLQRLVLAQDTGSAIVGAVRADYYAGSGDEAGELAGRMKQALRLWVLWPK